MPTTEKFYEHRTEAIPASREQAFEAGTRRFAAPANKHLPVSTGRARSRLGGLPAAAASLVRILLSARVFRWVLLGADLVWVVFSLWISHEIRYGLSGRVHQQHLSQLRPVFLTAPAVWSVLYFTMKLDGFDWGWNIVSVSSRQFLGVCALTAALSAGQFLLHDFVSRFIILCFGAVMFAGSVAVRCTALFACGRINVRRRVVVAGNGAISRELAASIERRPELLYNVVGFLFLDTDGFTLPDDKAVQTECNAVRTLGVSGLLRQHRVEELILALPPNPTAEVHKLVASCRNLGISVSVVPNSYELYLSKARLKEIGGVPLLSLEPCRISAAGAVVKRIVDLVGAGALLFVTSPLLMAAVALLHVRKGRAFTLEMRSGKDGQSFQMYRLNIDRDRPENALERGISELSLTELPQLFNVLRGEMSLVGPRPETPERTKHYSDWQRQRLNVAPGVTGLAQVHGLRDRHPSEEKARFDLQYVLRWSPVLDLCLILQTIGTLLTRIGSQRTAVPPKHHFYPSR